MGTKDIVMMEDMLEDDNVIDISKMVDHFQGVIDQALAGKMWPPVPARDPGPAPYDPEPGFGDGDYSD